MSSNNPSLQRRQLFVLPGLRSTIQLWHEEVRILPNSKGAGHKRASVLDQAGCRYISNKLEKP